MARSSKFLSHFCGVGRGLKLLMKRQALLNGNACHFAVEFNSALTKRWRVSEMMTALVPMSQKPMIDIRVEVRTTLSSFLKNNRDSPLAHLHFRIHHFLLNRSSNRKV